MGNSLLLEEDLVKLEELKKENADLKRQIETQRSNTLAQLEQLCHGVNEIRVSFGEKPCCEWLENAPNNWPHAFCEYQAAYYRMYLRYPTEAELLALCEKCSQRGICSAKAESREVCSSGLHKEWHQVLP